MSPVRTGLFRFVRIPEVETYHRLGWMVVRDLGPTHGRWSVLMWHCDCACLSVDEAAE